MLAHVRKTLASRGSETGASAVEYALLVVAIALIMVVGAFALGNAVNARFGNSANCVQNAAPGTAGCP